MKDNRTATIHVRVNDAELDIIARLAEMKGISRAACLRQATLEKARSEGLEARSSDLRPKT